MTGRRVYGIFFVYFSVPILCPVFDVKNSKKNLRNNNLKTFSEKLRLPALNPPQTSQPPSRYSFLLFEHFWADTIIKLGQLSILSANFAITYFVVLMRIGRNFRINFEQFAEVNISRVPTSPAIVVLISVLVYWLDLVVSRVFTAEQDESCSRFTFHIRSACGSGCIRHTSATA